MLKPYVCVACEKVILEQPPEGSPPGTSGVATLVSLFSKMIISVPAGTEIPPNAVAPKEWAVFSLWDVEPGDEHRNYILCTQVSFPDKSQFGELNKSPINVKPNTRSQMTIRIPGFPVGRPGPHIVSTWVEENGQKVCGPIEFKIEFEVQKEALAQKTS